MGEINRDRKSVRVKERERVGERNRDKKKGIGKEREGEWERQTGIGRVLE